MTQTFLEFFAGAGMARAGLGEKWRCLFANDIDLKKAATYEANWGTGTMVSGDVKTVTIPSLKDEIGLVWASFPCQDLSLAGAGAGLKGDRSGTFWPFWRQVRKLIEMGRAPRIVALENVAATLTSHNGRDFEELCLALTSEGYRVGARIVDAVKFVPQSRPRMFLIGVHHSCSIPDELLAVSSLEAVDPRVFSCIETIKTRSLSDCRLKDIVGNWINWNLPDPQVRRVMLEDVIEREPSSVAWHTAAETRTLIDRMSDLNRRKVERARAQNKRTIGTAYRRTRMESGVKAVRTEVRFDGIAGCLRTPAGGSSRQIVLEVENGSVRSRLMTTREGARLMGLPDSYQLPEAYNEGYHLVGDGVCVAVVAHLARNVFEPIIKHNNSFAVAA